jgi:uncharacterized protein YfaP (DUF2135 family)
MKKYSLFLILVILFCFTSCDTITHYIVRVSVDRDQSLTEDMLDFILGTANSSSGQITISLLWDSTDDLDLHVITPSGVEIFFGNMRADGGVLDVDMNAGSSNLVLNPVENIFFANPRPGTYRVKVVNYYDRTPDVDTNYLVRVMVGNNTSTFTGSIKGTGTEHEITVFTFP